VRIAPLLLALAVLPASAQSVRLSGGRKAEDRLRAFVEKNAALKARFDDAARREQAFVSDLRETDLRDAVSAFSGDRLRRGFVESLPGMRAPGLGCLALSDCAVPELAAEAVDARELPDTVRRLVRPWLLLQQARGSSLELVPQEGAGDAALVVRLRDADAAPLTLNVAPRLLGGFKVWFDRPFVLAALYDRERAAVLRR
jgi:hypothetical protein